MHAFDWMKVIYKGYMSNYSPKFKVTMCPVSNSKVVSHC